MKTSTFILLFMLVVAIPFSVSYGQARVSGGPGMAAKRLDTEKQMRRCEMTRSFVTSHTINAAICEGQVYILGSRSINASGQYRHSFPTNRGDSLVVVNLTVYNHVTKTEHLTVYAGQLPIDWNDVSIPAGSSSNAAFAIYNTYSSNGCDSIVTLDLTVIQDSVPRKNTPEQSGGDQATEPATDNGTATKETVSYTIENADICDGYAYYFNGKTYSETGTFTSVFKSEAGCDSIVSLTLSTHELPQVKILPMASGNTCTGDRILLVGDGATYYEWQVDSSNNFKGKVLETMLPEGRHHITLVGKDHFGCSASTRLLIDVKACNQVKMPGSFRPYEQGTFKPIQRIADRCIMNIYNQWGDAVCTVLNAEEGWNGNYSNGLPAASGVYYYMLHCNKQGLTQLLSRGKVLLMR